MSPCCPSGTGNGWSPASGPPRRRPALRRRDHPRPRFAVLAAAGMAIAALLAGTPEAQAPPASRHVEGAVTGPIVESPEALKVTTIIQCSCGGCANQTLHECTCGLAAGERRKIAEALAAGRTPDELIAAYVAEHG